MKKTYPVEVDCANCARKMEEAAGRTPGVAAASINFMTQKLSVEFAEGVEEQAVMRELLRVCRRVEPDCAIDF